MKIEGTVSLDYIFRKAARLRRWRDEEGAKGHEAERRILASKGDALIDVIESCTDYTHEEINYLIRVIGEEEETWK